MPINSEIQHDKRLVINRASNFIDLPTLLNFHHTIGQDASLFGYDEIFVTKTAKGWNIQHVELMKIARSVPSLPAIDTNARVALVVDKEKDSEIIAFYLAARALMPEKTRECEVFSTEEEARAWLGR